MCTRKKTTLFSDHYLRNRSTLDIGVLEDMIAEKLVFSDEATFHVCGKVNRHNVRIWVRTACSFRGAQAITLLEFMYHSRIVLSVGGSVWYVIRNLRCTVTIDSVLANSKTQNTFLFTVNVIFLHNYPLAVEPGSTPRPLVQKKLGEILYLLICSFLPCLSWLLRSRVRKSRRDL